MRQIAKKVYLSLRKVLFFIAYLTFFVLRKKEFDSSVVKNILVIPLYRLGDTVVSIPTFKAIKETFPKAQVTVFADVYAKQLLECIPYIDKIETYQGTYSFGKKLKMLKKITSKGFELGIDLTCDYTFVNVLLLFLSKVNYRLGYNIAQRGFLFHKSVAYSNKEVHMVDLLLSLVETVSIRTNDKSVKIIIPQAEQEEVVFLLKQQGIGDNDFVVGIHSGGFYQTQRWAYERWAKVADAMINKYKAKIILIGSEQEKQSLETIKENMKNELIVFSSNEIKKTLALIQRCNLFLSNNSGPLHMATALNRPTISTMGPTIADKWWPQGSKNIVLKKELPCLGCNSGVCKIKTHDCMNNITVNDMLEVIDKQLKANI